VSLILFVGCSKNIAVKDDNVIKASQEKVPVKEIVKRPDNVIKTKTAKPDNVNSEKLPSPSFEDLKSVKDDGKSEKDALIAKEKLLELQKIYFDYDRSDIRKDAKSILIDNVKILSDKKSVGVLIEGYCDERGTEEYNLALGQRRAESVKTYMATLGISEKRMSTISYGESKPEAKGSNESAWRLNRRAILKEVKK
jgi:peptidoglycan-associated lipoprotein